MRQHRRIQFRDPAALAADVLRAAGSGGGLLVASDYDGTLISLRPRPGDAVADPELIALLGRLSAHPRVVMALITGRSLSDLHAVLPEIKGLYRFGGHGGEGDAPGMRAFTLVSNPAPIRLLKNLASRMDRLSWPEGVWIERKGLALALHHLEAEAGDATRAELQFSETVIRSDPGGVLSLLGGKQVLEARPRELHKGLGITWLREKTGPDPVVAVYLGDDINDEDVFWTLTKSDFPVLVGEAAVPTAARHRLKGCKEARAFLGALLQGLEAPAAT